MKYWTRKESSQRTSAPVDITFTANYGGQDGWPFMTFWDGKLWHHIQPETIEDVRVLQSQASVLALNVKEQRS
jgi:hypothetical protein